MQMDVKQSDADCHHGKPTPDLQNYRLDWSCLREVMCPKLRPF